MHCLLSSNIYKGFCYAMIIIEQTLPWSGFKSVLPNQPGLMSCTDWQADGGCYVSLMVTRLSHIYSDTHTKKPVPETRNTEGFTRYFDTVCFTRLLQVPNRLSTPRLSLYCKQQKPGNKSRRRFFSSLIPRPLLPSSFLLFVVGKNEGEGRPERSCCMNSVTVYLGGRRGKGLVLF